MGPNLRNGEGRMEKSRKEKAEMDQSLSMNSNRKSENGNRSGLTGKTGDGRSEIGGLLGEGLRDPGESRQPELVPPMLAKLVRALPEGGVVVRVHPGYRGTFRLGAAQMCPGMSWRSSKKFSSRFWPIAMFLFELSANRFRSRRRKREI
jgi:hypothetical protein